MGTAVTVQITRQVTPQAAPKVEEWVARGQTLLSARAGYLGSGWVRSDATSQTWHMLYRFADHESLRAWEESDQRRVWAAEFSHHVVAERAQKRTGIEGWFDAPQEGDAAQAAPPVPPRWKQMIVICTGFFPLSLFSNWLFSLLLPHDFPLVGRVFCSIVLVMPLMTYLVLPLVTRMYQPWLSKEPRPTQAQQTQATSEGR